MPDILIKNARVNNLKNVTVDIPRNKLVVITGVSGSGKSSLAFDTLYAEGQRRYVESLSSYARQFLARMEKPDVDYIQGISPAMAIKQQVSTTNPRSTVGTTTEIYDFLKLLFARAGRTYSPISNELVKRDTVTDVVDFLIDLPEGSKVQLYADIKVRSKGTKAELELTLQKGFPRVLFKGEPRFIEDLLEEKKLPKLEHITLIIDRIAIRKDDLQNLRGRLGDSVQTAYQEGQGTCRIKVDDHEPVKFSERFEMDGLSFELPSVNLFSFNNPYGACSDCEGFGRVLGIDEKLVVPDHSKSVFEGAIAPWRGEVMSEYKDAFVRAAEQIDFPVHRPYYRLTRQERELLWDGIPGAEGIGDFFKYIASKTHKIQYRVMLARYRGYTTCPECKGSRLRKDANYVKVGGYSISDFLFMQLNELHDTISKLDVDEHQAAVGKRLLTEIKTRLSYLLKVGLGYLSLNRKVNSLSGGEMQRIRLATSLGSGLVGSMYILDEPSIGLHPRDTDRLIEILENLRDQGNTVIVVEHDEGIMKKSDRLIDMGPGAGELGGEVVFNGKFKSIFKEDTLTGKYLSGKEEIPVPAIRRKSGNKIQIQNAHTHNLKGIQVDIPLQGLTVVTGVSGSGKTTLVTEVLYPALQRQLGSMGNSSSTNGVLDGDTQLIKAVEMVDQRPIGRSARSNPVTYIKAYDVIRDLFSKQQLSQIKGLKPGAFSFNIDGGRCDNCKGDGKVVVEMQFLPDVELVCEVCGGKRFKKNVLEVQYKGKNINDVLNLTLHEGLEFFKEEKKIAHKLEILNRVGLGYLRMGQSTSTLSGGEAQRMKLASFLANTADSPSSGTFYIFDEPTTGLHFDDIKKLLAAMNELVERGSSVLVIEHNTDVIKCADWIIDLGPEGGDEGGELVFQGTPEDLIKEKKSYTAKYVAEKLV
ncbi:MAG: excinuclease ABC subunit UvrA [Bacteroidia bacterium]